MSSANEDRTVGALPGGGPNPAKANFFREVATAFEFLALYYSLSAEHQAELMNLVQSFTQVKVRKGK